MDQNARIVVIKEWNYEKNGNLNPNILSYGSSKKVWWKCSKCGYEWKSPVSSRTNGFGCSKCGHHKASEKRSICVSQFSIDGKFIKKFDSISKAKRETGIKKINEVCNGNRKTAGGYIWKYEK